MAIVQSLREVFKSDTRTVDQKYMDLVSDMHTFVENLGRLADDSADEVAEIKVQLLDLQNQHDNALLTQAKVAKVRDNFKQLLGVN